MGTAPFDSYTHEHPFRGFERSVERLLGVDARLLYGFAVPILMIIGLIILLAIHPSTWLVIAILLLEVGALGVIATGFVGMLNEEDDVDERELEL